MNPKYNEGRDAYRAGLPMDGKQQIAWINGWRDEKIVQEAICILEDRARYGESVVLGTPHAVRDFLRLQLGDQEHETFWCAWLNAQNQLIEFEQMASGTITQCSVYPRELVKAALRHNAAAVIFAHNHPSGTTEPSRADQNLTDQLKKALDLVGVRALDHLIVGQGGNILSFAERGLI